MSVAYYMDAQIRAQITNGLRARGVDVLTAQEDGCRDWEDEALLDRANEIGRTMFTCDRDFLVEATRRQQQGIAFAGIVYAHQMRVSIAQCIADLELIAA